MSLCELGIREKFVQNPHLMDTLVRRTENKTIVECAKDCLWGTGSALSEESCLNRDRWITQGILGHILERIHNEFKSYVTLPSQPYVGAYPPHTLLPRPAFPPPPGFEHPMITIAQQPNAFRPSLLLPATRDAPLVEGVTNVAQMNTLTEGITSPATSNEPTVITSASATDSTLPISPDIPQTHEDMDTQRPTPVLSDTTKII